MIRYAPTLLLLLAILLPGPAPAGGPPTSSAPAAGEPPTASAPAAVEPPTSSAPAVAEPPTASAPAAATASVTDSAPGPTAADREQQRCVDPTEGLPPLEDWRFQPGDDPAWSRPDLDDSSWLRVTMPAPWEELGRGPIDGFGWLRVHFILTGPLPCRPVGALLGTLDDADETWLNGVLIGRTGIMPPNPEGRSSVRRIYALPAGLLHAGDNVIAIRVFDSGGPGGMTRGPVRLGDLQALASDLSLRDIVPLVAPFLFLLVGFYHLLLFRYRPSARQNLYFFGFTVGISALVMSRSQLPAMLHLPAGMIEELNWLGIFLSPVLFVEFLIAQLERRRPRVLLLAEAILVLLAALSIVWPDPRFWHDLFFWAGQPAVLFIVAFVTWALIDAARSGPADARKLLGGFAFLGAAVVVEIAGSYLGHPAPSLIPGALTTFILFVVAVLAQREVQRSVELEGTAGALKDLNTTLEQQVRVRTRHLEKARHQLEERTHRLERARETLEERTGHLESARQELEERTGHLETARQALEDRTFHLEAARAELERRNASLADFNSLVSHDLKAPLRGIETLTGFLEADYGARLDAEGLHLIELIRASSRQMRGLVEGLTTLARLDRQVELKPVSLGVVMESVRGLLAAQLRTRGAILQIEGPLPAVRGNEVWLLEVFSNLVSNGLKYNQAARPEVVIAVPEADEAGLEQIAPGEVCVVVRDNGIGIEEAYQRQIFEPGKRLHTSAEYEGSGLGLSIVRKAIRAMRGRIWLRSTPGLGTTFYVVLPGPNSELYGAAVTLG